MEDISHAQLVTKPTMARRESFTLAVALCYKVPQSQRSFMGRLKGTSTH